MYATVSEVKWAVARDPAQQRGNAASLSESQFNQVIAQAQAEIDGRLSGRYTVPFSVVPELVKSITLDIASYRAALVFYQDQDLSESNTFALRYKLAVKLLDSLAAGEVSLPDDPSDPGDGVVTHSMVGAPVNPGVGSLAAEFLDCGW